MGPGLAYVKRLDSRLGAIIMVAAISFAHFGASPDEDRQSK
jgi:hypothetical protein